jgi:quinol monooxygenase YgiN
MRNNLVRLISALSVSLSVTVFATAARSAELPESQVIVITHIDLLPDTAIPNGVETGIALLKTYVEGARATGAKTARLITWAPTTNHFQIVEVWDSMATFNAHVESGQSVNFRNDLQALIGSPYEQRVYHPVGGSLAPARGDYIGSPF